MSESNHFAECLRLYMETSRGKPVELNWREEDKDIPCLVLRSLRALPLSEGCGDAARVENAMIASAAATMLFLTVLAPEGFSKEVHGQYLKTLSVERMVKTLRSSLVKRLESRLDDTLGDSLIAVAAMCLVDFDGLIKSQLRTH